MYFYIILFNLERRSLGSSRNLPSLRSHINKYSYKKKVYSFFMSFIHSNLKILLVGDEVNLTYPYEV